jgi:hypothetical protein
MDKKIYCDEMTTADMEKYGVEYWSCFNCDYKPLIWSNYIGDSSCESCGQWQDGKEK